MRRTALDHWTARSAIFWVGVVALAVALTQVLRVAAEHWLAGVDGGGPWLVVHIPTRTGMLTWLPPAAVIAALVLARSTAARAALAVLLAGSIANNIERLVLGRVTTYFRWSTVKAPVNAADILMSAGVGALLLVLLAWLVRSR